MKVTAKEWCIMSDHNKQLLLNAVATYRGRMHERLTDQEHQQIARCML